MKRDAEKKVKKKSADTPMETSPDAQVMDIIDQRFKQLGRRSRSNNSPGSSKSHSVSLDSRSRSKSASTSHGPSLSSGSSRSSRGHYHSYLKQRAQIRRAQLNSYI